MASKAVFPRHTASAWFRWASLSLGTGATVLSQSSSMLQTLGLDPAKWSGNQSILYFQGPVQVCANKRSSLPHLRAAHPATPVEAMVRRELYSPGPFHERNTHRPPAMDHWPTDQHAGDPHDAVWWRPRPHQLATPRGGCAPALGLDPWLRAVDGQSHLRIRASSSARQGERRMALP